MARLNNCRFNPTAGSTTDWTYSSAVAGYNDPVTAGAVTATPYEYFAISADGLQFEGGKGNCTIAAGVPTFARTTVLFNSSGTTAKINFSAAPQVAIVVFKDDLLSVDEDNSFTATQQNQAQKNIGLPYTRQNDLLNAIYQSKLFGGYRRLVNVFADGYKAVDGINSGSSSNYSVDTTNGKLVAPQNGNDSFTKILLHMDGTNGGTTFTDSNAGGSAHSWTATSATTSTGTVKIGTASLSCGSTGFITTADSTDFTLGSGDFCVECWFNVSGGAGAKRFMGGQCNAAGQSTSIPFDLGIDASNHMFGEMCSGISVFTVTGTTAFTSTGWHHFAFTRNGNTLRLFIDGVQEGGNVSCSGSANDSTSNFSVGRLGDFTTSTWNGFIDEFRLSVGAARYTANFTPQTTQFDATYLSMTAITTAQTADASVGNGRVLLEYDNLDSPTLNTDLTAEVTCDGGAHWTSASLSAVTSNSQGGRKVAETVDQSTTAGTSFCARIKTANGKNVPIYGVALAVH